MCVIYWDSKLTHWLHNTLLDNLEMSYLVAYVEILQVNFFFLFDPHIVLFFFLLIQCLFLFSVYFDLS